MNIRISLLVFGLLFSTSPQLRAANFIFGEWTNEPLAFSFSIFREPVFFDGIASELSGKKTGVRVELIESFLGSHLNLGMQADRYWLDDFGINAYEGSGYSLGLSSSLLGPHWKYFRLGTRLAYTYNSAQADNDGLEITLHGLEAEVVAASYLFDIIGLYLGVGVGAQDGGVRGGDQQVVSWSAPISHFYKFGLDILVEPGGHIGIESKIKEFLTFEVYFQRRY